MAPIMQEHAGKINLPDHGPVPPHVRDSEIQIIKGEGSPPVRS